MIETKKKPIKNMLVVVRKLKCRQEDEESKLVYQKVKRAQELFPKIYYRQVVDCVS